MEKFNRRYNEFERKDPLVETFKSFNKREEEIINLVFSIAKEDNFFINNIYVPHVDLIDRESLSLYWIETPLEKFSECLGTINLSKNLYDNESKLLTNFPDFKPKYRLEIGILTDLDELHKIIADNGPIKEISTIYLFDDDGKGEKLIHVDKKLGLLKHFTNWKERMKYETENYVYLHSEFNGGDLELVDFSLFKLKEKIIQEMEKKNNGKF